MESGAGNDPVGAGEDEPHVIVLDAPDVERDDGKRGVFVVDGDVWFLLQLPDEEPGLAFCFFRDGCYPDGRDVVRSGRESRKAGVVVGPCLEPLRHLSGLEEREGVGPGPSVADRGDRFRVPQVEPTGARDAEEALVAGEGVGIDRELLEVDGYMAGGLRSVDDEEDPVIVQDLPDAGDVLHRAEHVAPVGRDHEPGIGRYGCLDTLRADSAVLEGEDRQPDATLPFELMKRS